MKKIFSILVCLLIILSLSSCNGKKNEQSLNAKIGTWKTAQTIQPFFYNDFLEENEAVEILSFTNPGDMKSALLAGSLDMCGTTIVTAITAASKGEPIVVLCGLSNKCSALVVSENSNIYSVSDLKGKKIAYVPGTMHHLLLLETLTSNGLNPNNDVELIRIDFFDMGQALLQGNIDAFYSGEPYPSIAVTEGYGRILLYPNDNEGFGIINSAMITTKEKASMDADRIQKLLLAHIKATEYLNSNTEEWLNKASEFGTDITVLNKASDNIQLFWKINEEYISSVKNLAQKMLEQGLISELPNFEDMFDLKFMENAKKEI
jgi:NitT/TauT family transport system substrate-binding protein